MGLLKPQKRICRAVGPSLAASLEPLAHHRSVASLSFFCRYYFGRSLSELAQLVPLPYSRGGSTCYSDRLHYFSVTTPRCYKDVYNTEFDDIIIIFKDQNGRPSEIEDKISLTRFSFEPVTRKYVKRYEFLSFARNLSDKYGKILLDTATKTELDAAETASKKVVCKRAEATGELIGNKTAKKIVKPCLMRIQKMLKKQ